MVEDGISVEIMFPGNQEHRSCQRTVCGQLATALMSIRRLISDKLFSSSLLQVFSLRWGQKSTFGGREDGSVGKVPTIKHDNLSLDSQHPHKPSMVVPVSDPRIGTETRIPEAYQPANLADWVSSRFSKRPYLKK